MLRRKDTVIFKALLAFVVFAFPAKQQAQDVCSDCCEPAIHPHQFYIGPEAYYLLRSKEGGTKQQGYAVGLRASYDRIKRYGYYWGIEGFYAAGRLTGKSGRGVHLKSLMRDASVEGRIGYTFQQKCGHQFSFTPYIGYGYFWETNKFTHPSNLRIKARNTFDYIALGFLSNMKVCPQLSAGINFKTRFMFDAKCRITSDPEFDDMDQNIGNKNQYRVELPLTYQFCESELFDVALVPFYEFRHYGEHINFPFDFLETKFNIVGVNLRFLCIF